MKRLRLKMVRKDLLAILNLHFRMDFACGCLAKVMK